MPSNPADAFDVVIPSMPGHGFSGRPAGIGWGPEHIARVWAELMRRLGYTRYVAQGGDWGAVMSTEFARQAPPGLLGIHLNLPATVPPEVSAALASGTPAPAGLSEQELAVFNALRKYGMGGNSSYFAMLTARPQAMGYGLNDSPVGMAAFMLVHPGFAKWAYGDDDATKTPTRDQVLDDFTLYWLTNTSASAGRLYWENLGRNPTQSSAWKTTELTLPAITVFPEGVYRPPETWARRAYRNLIYLHEVDKGTHFAAWEQPRLFSEKLRAAFDPCATRGGPDVRNQRTQSPSFLRCCGRRRCRSSAEEVKRHD